MPAVAARDLWPGVQNLQYLVVFGASYCDVGYNSKAPRPSAENPLGVKFPGETWCGHYDGATNTITCEPNWVGHLLQLIQDQRAHPSLLVYDYALGGDRVDGVHRQVHKDFLPHLATKPDWAPWTANDTLFVTWVGINDCSWNMDTPNPTASSQESIRALFAIQQELYEAGARNFCFIDVPPTYDFSGPGPKPQKLQDGVLEWNSALSGASAKFAAEHTDATVLVWSSWRLFSDILANPAAYGFSQEDAAKEEGAIFEDGLHPTSAVHRVIAQELLEFLSTVTRPEEA
ncbi:uncharacterized protein TRAVEDRAFT_120349 [Trametes versicolor FP-101664 SS1]|uniref:uncharacterized protein n=1 Tax=Trametes versicolor (strain FP-101664) TaxID=717944 RepID=UPI000462414E|nr:uncharacterized protein TRAVEDRAFT_120349 [Trametes versicolor FP-101664 SS1]EIW61069.1 hypothetical protein TRAVEDRAFT_120349 [Trametes versicolor FP-101664 SS1]